MYFSGMVLSGLGYLPQIGQGKLKSTERVLREAKGDLLTSVKRSNHPGELFLVIHKIDTGYRLGNEIPSVTATKCEPLCRCSSRARTSPSNLQTEPP